MSNTFMARLSASVQSFCALLRTFVRLAKMWQISGRRSPCLLLSERHNDRHWRGCQKMACVALHEIANVCI